jgi:phosphinothricin acetyltransferase
MIRLATPDDGARLAEFYAPAVVGSGISFEHECPDAVQHRAGVARALYTSLFAALAVQGFHNAYAGVALPNDASLAFHASMGFTAVGTCHRVGYKLGRWRDVRWFERTILPHVDEPRPPRLLPDVRDDAAFIAALSAGQCA